jgi:hypothetical protein
MTATFTSLFPERPVSQNADHDGVGAFPKTPLGQNRTKRGLYNILDATSDETLIRAQPHPVQKWLRRHRSWATAAIRHTPACPTCRGAIKAKRHLKYQIFVKLKKSSTRD